MPARPVPGVFCLETPWSDDDLADAATVGPLLDVLRGRGLIRYIHRDAATVPEFEHYLQEWAQKKYADYSLCYLGFHGYRSGIWIGQEEYDVDLLARLLEGRLAGRIVYFGSCRTLAMSRERADSFLKATMASAICGFTRDVPWIESAAFDLNLIEALTNYSRAPFAFRFLAGKHPGPCERLGFRAAWKGGAVWE